VDGEAYDFEARYAIGETEFRCPAALPADTAARAAEIARAVWDELRLEGFARVDLMLDDATGDLWVLEANPVPGLTETSLLPQAAEAAGIGFDTLVERILARAT
jgi:D-alanine-D-alanine ligase